MKSGLSSAGFALTAWQAALKAEEVKTLTSRKQNVLP